MTVEETTTGTTTAAAESPGNAPQTMISAPPAPMMPEAADTAPPAAPPAPANEREIGEDAAQLAATLGEIEALRAQIEALQSTQADEAAQLKRHEAAMRDTLLSKLGVMDKYRGYAPPVDPFTDEGRAELERWAADNSELTDARPAALPPVDVDAMKGRLKSPHLVDLASFAKSMKGA